MINRPLRDLILDQDDFVEVIRVLTRAGSDPVTPFSILWIMQMELGVSFVETRRMLEFFDPDLGPLVDTAIINERWHTILAGHGLAHPEA